MHTDPTIKALRRERELLSIALERNTLCEALLIENDKLRREAQAAQAPAAPDQEGSQ